MKASIKEVAKLAGVSVATVSNVLNNTKKVRTETKQRVTEAVQKLNYQINPLARNFRKGESKIIGFVVSNLANYFFQDIAQSLEKRLARDGFRPVLIDSKEDKATEIENVRNLLASSVDGLVIAPTTEDCSYLNFLLEDQNTPIVFIDRKPVGFDGDLIMSTNEQGMHEAVKHLISKGHREIAFIGSRYDSTMNERISGYRKAMHEASIPVNENHIKIGEGLSVNQMELKHGISYHQTLELLTDHNISAIVSGNNLATVGVFSFMRETNIQLPKDIAFITFDDSFWLTMTTPSISAIAQDTEEIGRKAAEVLCERITLPKSKNIPPRLIRISTHLIIRGSC